MCGSCKEHNPTGPANSLMRKTKKTATKKDTVKRKTVAKKKTANRK